jgi:hypothetical protein
LPVGTSKNNISHTPEGRARPSLLSTSAPYADHNILDAVGARADTPALAWRRWWLLLPLIAATVWAITAQREQPPAVRPVAQPAPQTAASTVAAMVAQPTAPAALATPSVPVAADTPSTVPTASATTGQVNPFSGLEAATTPTATPAPGATTSAAALASTTPQRNSSTRPAADLQAALDGKPQRPAEPTKVKPTPAKSASTDVRQRTEPEKAVAKTKPAALPTPGKAVQTARKPANEATPPASGTRTASASATDSKKASTSRDPDVELLSAIMKHLNEGKGSATTAAPTRSAQTIAELVRSCKTQDSINALLCQRRICEGSWGKAEACPKSQAPKTAQAQANH